MLSRLCSEGTESAADHELEPSVSKKDEKTMQTLIILIFLALLKAFKLVIL